MGWDGGRKCEGAIQLSHTFLDCKGIFKGYKERLKVKYFQSLFIVLLQFEETWERG